VSYPVIAEKSEEEWQAESDARALEEARLIQADSSRLERAQTAAKRLAKEKQEEADAMKVVAGGKAAKKKDDWPMEYKGL
jgi:hypothetical protein